MRDGATACTGAVHPESSDRQNPSNPDSRPPTLVVRTRRGVAWQVALTIVVALVLLTTAGLEPVAARDWNRVDDPLQGAVGVHAGKVAGTGLSFKLPLQWFLYLQATGLIWHTSENQWHNYGFSLQYLLRQDQTMRLFLAGGVARYYHKKINDDGPDEEDTSWNGGLGVGTEFLLGSRVSAQVQLDFTYEGKDEDITLFPQAGIYFYW